METLTASLQTRIRTSNREIQDTLLEIHEETDFLHSLTSFPDRFRHIIYLRLAQHEKTQLENEVFCSGYREFHGEREAAEKLSHDPTTFIDYIALLVFRRWSWADAVLRHILAELLGITPGEEPDGGALLDAFVSALGTRHDELLPGDSRKYRVNDLLADGINAEFFSTLKTAPGEILNLHPRGLAVAPHPDDLPVWRLLAYQVQKNDRILRKWPGIQEAAVIAGEWEGREWEDHYPYYGEWRDVDQADSSLTSSQGEESERDDVSVGGASNAGADIEGGARDAQEFPNSDIVPQPEGEEAQEKTSSPFIPGTEASISPSPSYSSDSDYESITSSIRRRNDQRADLYALFDASDVWDAWILCQMLRCEEAIWGVDQCEGTERAFRVFEKLPLFQERWVRREVGPRYYECGFLQRVPLMEAAVVGSTQPFQTAEDSLVQQYLSLKQLYPIPLPREFIEFADYGNYRFCDIEDEDIITSLLTSAGLLGEPLPDDPVFIVDTNSLNTPNMKWDLTFLNWSRRDPLRDDSDREHLHHTLHLSDDYIQTAYDKEVDLPGLCHPCACRELSKEEIDREFQDLDRDDSADEGERVIRGPLSPEDVAPRRKESQDKLKRDMGRRGRWRRYPENHYEYDHAGGNVVFNRRRVEDVPEFVKNLDRFWVDWNDSMLIMGAGEDEDLGITDEDTIYILETLPGIKARWEKENTKGAR